MADKKLNEVTKVTDMAYVPVILSDGSVGQIAKADLATVVAEIMGLKKIRVASSCCGSIIDHCSIQKKVTTVVLRGKTNLPN